MLLSGRVAFARKLLSNLKCPETQVQSTGIDLSLAQVLTYNTAGQFGFNSSNHATSQTSPLSFTRVGDRPADITSRSIHLYRGSYLVEFNEKLSMAKGIMGEIYVHNSLSRSGASVQAGVVDSNCEGVICTMLVVENPYGLRLAKDATIVRMVFHQLSEPMDDSVAQDKSMS